MALRPLPVTHINHITRVVKDVEKSIEFYEQVLGFIQIRRPGALNEASEGAWLWRADLSIHLLLGVPTPRSSSIDVCSDHLSFQPSGTFQEIEQCLQAHGIDYIVQTVEEGGLVVPQLFFHDPDNNMIEICPCDCLPVCPVDKGNDALELNGVNNNHPGSSSSSDYDVENTMLHVHDGYSPRGSFRNLRSSVSCPLIT